MELKVWCEGIPRVVCGITEKTTCRDVVIALAQAMGKVGQYTLIEKWRDRERFIPPDESLLLALGKWGEYAREVQLVLRRSEGRLKVNGHQGDRSSDESKWTNKLSGFSLPHQDKPRPSSSSSIRKSLTFSGAHSHHHVVTGSDTSVNHVDNGSINGSASVENMLECDPEACRDSRTSFSRDTIQAHTENGPRWQQINHASSQSALSSLGNKSDRLSGRSVSQHGNVPFSYSPGLALGGSLERTRRRNRDHSHQSSNISVAGTTVTSVHGVVTSVHNSATSVHNSTAPVLSVSTAVSATSSTQNVQSSLPVSDSSTWSNTKHPSPVTSRLPSLQRDIKPLSRESNNNIDFKPNANLTGAGCDLITGEKCHSKDVYSNEEEKKLELLKLVSEQQEKLEKQERNIEKLEADISLIEHFDHEPKENSNITQELERLEKLDSELDNEIQELELVSWEGKLELEMEKEKRIRSEIETIRKKLKSCESELERMNAKIKELTEEISRQKELQNIEEKCQKEQEAKVLAEIAKLQKQIEAKTSAYQNQLKSVEELSNDLTKKEAEIEEKKKKIAELERELKESNMKLFVRSPGDLIRRSLEGQSLLSRVSRSRPSSARRLDNPDHRNDPVATPKNPHGLWV